MAPVCAATDMPIVFQDRVNAGDLDGLLALVAPGAVSRALTGEVLTTPDEIRTEMAGLLAGHPKLHNRPRHVLVSGDTALLVIDWTLDVDGSDRRVQLSGTTANVLRHTEQEGWRFSVLNPAGTAAP